MDLNDPRKRRGIISKMAEKYKNEIKIGFVVTCHFNMAGINPHESLTKTSTVINKLVVDISASYSSAIGDGGLGWESRFVRKYLLDVLDGFVWHRLIEDGDFAIGRRVVGFLV
jgi:hypothetical protein